MQELESCEIQAMLVHTFDDADHIGSLSAHFERSFVNEYSLFDPIIEDLMLLCSHRKDSIESKSILFRARTNLIRFELDCLEVFIESNHDLPAFTLFNRVYWTKPNALQ